MHVEAVANVVGLAEVQSALLFLAACVVHLRARSGAESLDGPSGQRLDGYRHPYGAARTAAVTSLFLSALLTKESAVTLPGALFLLDAARERLAPADLKGYVRHRWPLYLALLLSATAVLVARFHILGSVAQPLASLGGDLLEGGVPRIWTLAQAWVHYLRLLIFPLALSTQATARRTWAAIAIRSPGGSVLHHPHLRRPRSPKPSRCLSPAPPSPVLVDHHKSRVLPFHRPVTTVGCLIRPPRPSPT